MGVAVGLCRKCTAQKEHDMPTIAAAWFQCDMTKNLLMTHAEELVCATKETAKQFAISVPQESTNPQLKKEFWLKNLIGFQQKQCLQVKSALKQALSNFLSLSKVMYFPFSVCL